jgi:NAD(P)-dependent dehydrogenase (short-subunit alcohol dehydrogenase family)
VADFFSTIGEFDHLAVTAGELLDLGEFAAVDLGRARRFFEIRFWGAFAAAKYAAKQIKSTGSIILTNGIIGLRPQKGWVIAAGICGALEAARPRKSRLAALPAWLPEDTRELSRVTFMPAASGPLLSCQDVHQHPFRA